MVVIKCKMLEINQIIGFMEQFFKEYLTYFQPTTTLHYLAGVTTCHRRAFSAIIIQMFFTFKIILVYKQG